MCSDPTTSIPTTGMRATEFRRWWITSPEFKKSSAKGPVGSFTKNHYKQVNSTVLLKNIKQVVEVIRPDAKTRFRLND